MAAGCTQAGAMVKVEKRAARRAKSGEFYPRGGGIVLVLVLLLVLVSSGWIDEKAGKMA